MSDKPIGVVFKEPISDATPPVMSEKASTVETNKNFPFTAADIRYGEWKAVLQAAVKVIDSEITPPVDIVKALLSYTVEAQSSDLLPGDRLMAQMHEENEGLSINPEPVNLDELPWPETDKTTSKLKPEPTLAEWMYAVKPRVSKTYPGGVDAEADNLTYLAFDLARKAEPKEQKELAEWMLNLIPYTADSERDSYVGATFKFIRESSFTKELFTSVVNKLYSQRSNFTYRRHEESQAYNSITDELANEMVWPKNRKLFFSAISEMETDDERKTLLGMMVTRVSYPAILNDLRSLIKETEDEEEKARLTHLGQILLGKNVPFHLDLDSVYESHDFGHNPNYENAQNEQLNILKEVLDYIPEKDGLLVGLGCGYGGVENALAREQIEGKNSSHVRIVGVDKSVKFLEAAKAADETGKVEYSLGDMRRTEIPSNSAFLTTSLGRNDTHLEDERELIEAIRERVRITKVGGGILFDMPDPLLGDYLKERRNHIEVLKDLKIPVEKLADEDFWLSERAYIVDGPKGENQHMYNRLTPTISKIMELYKHEGCDIKVFKRLPIPGGHGDENVYFLAIKKEEADAETLELRQKLQELAQAA